MANLGNKSALVAVFRHRDVLVTDAGHAILEPFAEATLQELDRVIDINFHGVLMATQAALKHLKRGGRIIDIGSCAGECLGTPGLAAYAATKGAVKCSPKVWREKSSRAGSWSTTSSPAPSIPI